MHTTDLLHRPPVAWPQHEAPLRPALAPSIHQLMGPVRSAILRARRALENEQRHDGSWLGRQCGHASTAGQLVLLLTYLERHDSELAEQAANAIRADQRTDGAWSQSPDGPADASASVTAYFALKIMGDAPTQQHMRRAREAIRQLGGADAVDEITRLWLALLGQIDYEYCEPIAPEWLLLADRWQRRIFGGQLKLADCRRLTATSIVWALRPSRPVELSRGIRELFIRSPENWPKCRERATRGARAWATLSVLCERAGFVPFRQRALALAEALSAHEARDAETREVGFVELTWEIVALHALGYAAEGAQLAAAETRLRQLLVVDDRDAARPIPTTTSASDTVRALTALAAGGIAPTQSVVANGAAWLVHHVAAQSFLEGIETPMELASLLGALVDIKSEADVAPALPPDIQMRRDRLARFLARRRNRELPQSAIHDLAARVCDLLAAKLRAADFADDIGSALDALAKHGLPLDNIAMVCGAAVLRGKQRADGSWADATGEPTIGATAWATRGLIAAGAAPDDSAIAAGVNWLLVQQLETGDWGDVPSTASVVLALTAVGAADQEAACRGIEALVDWYERVEGEDDQPDLDHLTASLLALARWAVAADELPAEAAPAPLRLVGDLQPVN